MSNVTIGNNALEKGNALYRKGNFQEAAESFESAIASYQSARTAKETVESNNEGAAKNNLSVAYNMLGSKAIDKDTQGAIKAFKKAVEANPKSFSANYNLGFAYKKNGDVKDAIKYFEAAENLNNKEFNTLYNLAECYKANEENTKAITKFQESAKLLDALEVSNILTVHSKIIETTLLGKDQNTINQVAQEAFAYASKADISDYTKTKSQLNYIMLHYANSCLNDNEKAQNLDSIAKLYVKVNPKETLYSALINSIYYEYNHASAETTTQEKIVKAEHSLGYLVKHDKESGVFDAVKEAAKVIAQQDASSVLPDKIVLAYTVDQLVEVIGASLTV